MKPVALFAFLMFIHISSAYNQSVRLSVDLPVGYRYNTETYGNLVVEQEFMGIRYNTQMEITTVMQIEVVGKDADLSYFLSASYQRMDIRVVNLNINMEVSTESVVPGDSLSAILQTLRGKMFQVILTNKGEISQISGLDEMIIETIEPSNLPEVEKFEFTRNLIQSIGKEALMDYYRNTGSYYPEYAVKVSDQWNYRVNVMKSGIPMELTSNIRMKEISKNTAFMLSESIINTRNDYSGQEIQQATNPVFKLTGNEISEVKMDIRTGLILESIVSQNVTGVIRAPAEDNPEQVMTIPFKIISRNSIRTTPVK